MLYRRRLGWNIIFRFALNYIKSYKYRHRSAYCNFVYVKFPSTTLDLEMMFETAKHREFLYFQIAKRNRLRNLPSGWFTVILDPFYVIYNIFANFSSDMFLFSCQANNKHRLSLGVNTMTVPIKLWLIYLQVYGFSRHPLDGRAVELSR